MFKLVICDDEGKTTIVPLIRDEVTIGRKEGNTIRLTDRNVSRNHTRLVRSADNTFTVTDLGSRNGTKINNDPIGSTPLPVAPGDQIYIGDYNLSIRTDVADGVPMGRQMDPGDSAGIGKVTSHARLVMLAGPEPGKEIDLNVSLYVIGRSEEANMRIEDPSISRAHARLDGDDQQWTISDLDSINGIFINGAKRDDYLLKSGDVVELGTVRLRFVAPGEPYEYRPTAADSVAPRTGGPNKLFIVLGLVAAVAIAAVVAAVLLLGSEEVSEVPDDGAAVTDEATIAGLIEGGKDQMQSQSWEEAARLFGEALRLQPENEIARELKKTALAELEAQAAFNDALEAQERKDWQKAVDAIAAIPRSSRYYDKEQVVELCDALCEELLETARLISMSGVEGEADPTIEKIDKLPEVSDKCRAGKEGLLKTLKKPGGPASAAVQEAGIIIPAPKPVEANPYGGAPVPAPKKTGPANPYDNPYDDEPAKKPAAASPGAPAPGPQPIAPSYPVTGDDDEAPPAKKGPKKITWGD